ncbi:MAG: hypothetical protein JXX28_10825 [Deltaproteobacteria bacterium]|nr:hypothetical protein [Deltaproteobacteria bacterium]
MRRALRWLGGGALAALASALVVVLAWLVITFGPYLLDDLRLDQVVEVVAIEWRDFGRERGVERLQYELDHTGIDEAHVADHHCALAEEQGRRTVDCQWSATEVIPLIDRPIVLHFQSRKALD